MTALEILKAAREKVAAGWTQKFYFREVAGVGCFCAMGAVNEAAVVAGYADHAGALDALKHAIDGVSEMSIVHWNDRAGRTKDEVLAAFDRAIELAAKESP